MVARRGSARGTGVRVIAGEAKGRRLATPEGGGTRPITDRVKESLFGMLMPWLHDATVLDLYAGSGAMAIEALSRGAGRAVLVERDPAAAAIIEENLRTVGFEAVTEVRKADVHAFLGAGPAPAEPSEPSGRASYDLVFLDPPYAMPTAEVEADLEALASGWVETDALVVVRRHRDAGEPSPPAGFEFTRARTYGDTLVLVASVD